MALPIQPIDLQNAKQDTDHIAAIATSTALTATDRLGQTKRTLAGVDAYAQGRVDTLIDDTTQMATVALGNLGYLPPVAYAAGIVLSATNQTVSQDGIVYAPRIDALPFTTSGLFETDKFRIVQSEFGGISTDGNLSAAASWVPVPKVKTVLDDPDETLNAPAQALLNRQEILAAVVPHSIVRYGAQGSPENDTAAFNAARSATNGRYHIPKGTWIVDASPDIFGDSFTASDETFVVIDGESYEVSNAFAGALCYRTLSPVLTAIVHAKSGNVILAMQDGGPGTATYFYRGLAFRTDSHFMQVKPATAGGSTDLLVQRSDAHATDPNGNRFALTFEEAADLLSLSFATTAGGAPNFDTAVAIRGGLDPYLAFPALPALFQQGLGVQTRGSGALNIRWEPLSNILQRWYDVTTGNVLGSMSRSHTDWAGIDFDTLLDTPAGIVKPKRWGGVWSDISGPTLPITVDILNTSGGARNALIGTLRVAATPSGAPGGWLESRVTFDGTTVTMTDVIPNTLPAGFSVSVFFSGGNIRLSASYSGASGGGYTLCASFEWSGASR